jgi:hypothetical protein
MPREPSDAADDLRKQMLSQLAICLANRGADQVVNIDRMLFPIRLSHR